MHRLFYIFLSVFIACGATTNTSVETHTVSNGNFLNRVTVTGELEAVRSKLISAPPISWRFGDLKIVKLVDDGTPVKENDLLVQFDKSEVEKALNEAKSNLEIAESELRKTQAKNKSESESKEIDLEIARITHQITTLKLEQASFKAEIDRKQDEFSLEEAAINLNRVEQELENQKNIQHEEISKLELRVKQEQAKLDEAQNTLAMLTVTAPAPGIAIIRRNNYTRNKFQVDDQTWPGNPLIGLPDLSEMKAQVQINEIDIAKITLGQKTLITLDAYQDTTFTGKIIEIATLAHNKSNEEKVKVFDIVVLIDGQDERLLPGLTISCDIIVNELTNVIAIPIAALFEQDNKTIVYLQKGSGFVVQPVTLGDENDTHVVIKEGLSSGDVIALANPTIATQQVSTGSPQ
jgi:HlyD family secretion protein